MEKIALNGAYYAVEFIKLMFTARCFFNIQIKRNIYFWFIISLIANMFLLPCNYIVDSNPLIYMISMYVVFFVALHDKKSIGWIIFTNISISILDIFISCIIMLFYPKSAELILNSSVFIVLINSISMVLFIFINCFIYKRKEKRYYLKNSDAYICIVCAIAVMIIIAPIQMWMLGYHDDFGVLSTLLAVALIVVSFFVLFYKKQREFINYEKDMVQELLNAQETYYNTLLKKDEETKCFRHDIKQYIFCLQMLQKEKRYNELDDYLSQMELRLNQICPDYAVGNEYINMILSELSTRFEDVKLDWVGKVPTLCMESMVMIGYALYICLISTLFPSFNLYQPELQMTISEEIYGSNPFFSDLNKISITFLKLGEIFLYGLFSSVFVVFLSSFVKNKYLVLCVPFFIQYGITQFCMKIRITEINNAEKMNEKLIYISNIILPESVADLSQYVFYIKYIIVYNIAKMILLYIAYMIINYRRVDYGE